MAEGLKILVVLGSMRQGRCGERVAKMITMKLRECGHIPNLLDPETIENDGKLIQPMHFHPDQTKVPEWMININKLIQECDGLVVVTPEYNCSLPPALTALLDNFPPSSFRHKPAAISCYSMGPFGGIRAAALARPFLSELGLVTIPHVLVIPEVTQKVSEDGKTDDERISRNVEKLIKELIWYSAAFSNHAAKQGKPS